MGRRTQPRFAIRSRFVGLLFLILLAVLLIVPVGLPADRPPGTSTAPHSSGALQVAGPIPMAVKGTPDPALDFATSTAVSHEFAHSTHVRAVVAAVRGSYQISPYVAGVAYAPWNQQFYVAAPPSSVDVDPGGTIIAVGNGPYGIAVDPAAKLVFVTNTVSGNVTVINGSSNRTIGSVSVQSDPEGIAFDSANDSLYVANNGSDTVSVVDLPTERVVANLTVGSAPSGVAWDPASERVFVSDRGSDAVTVLSTGPAARPFNLSVGSAPDGVAVDPSNDAVYVANEGSNNVSVLSAALGTVIGNVPVVANGWSPDLQSLVYDPVRGVVWVTAGFSVVVINTSTERIEDEVDYDPAGIAIDPSSGEVCVTNAANSSFGCFDFSYTLPDANLTFAETGLPTGAHWNVTLEGPGDSATGSSNESNFTFGVDRAYYHGAGCSPSSYCYNYSFVAASATSRAPVPASGFVLAPTGGPSWVTIVFTGNGQYLVTFVGSGLPAGSAWSITLGGSTLNATGTEISFSETNGTFPFSVVGPSGEIATPSSGNLSVNGSTVREPINWTTGRGSGGNSRKYTLTFEESGLPRNTGWYVNLWNNSTNPSDGAGQSAPTDIDFSVSNGTYQYDTFAPMGWATSRPNGTIVVLGANITQSYNWTWIGVHEVQFTESGLASGTQWGVTVGPEFYNWTYGLGSAYAVSNWSTGTAISFEVMNGSWSYLVANLPNWTSSPSDGAFQMVGGPLSFPIGWASPSGYPITFEETGLANGTLWNVTIPSSASAYTTVGSTTSSITFSEPNGIYGFAVATITAFGRTEYLPSPSFGNVTVQGAATIVHVVYALAGGFYPVEFDEGGLPAGTQWSVGINGIGYGSTTTKVEAPELNGTYSYVAGGAVGYVPDPSSGSATVDGAPVVVNITFDLAAGYYAVEFEESGLGPGTSWSVTLGSATVSSTTGVVGFAEANGSYSYSIGLLSGYRVDTPRGSVVVAGAAPVPVVVQFESTDEYAIVFEESGLPTGLGWAVAVGSELNSSHANATVLLEPNGTYGYVVFPVTGYVAHDNGTVTVAGANSSVLVGFTPQTFPVVVAEFGLPIGTNWSVNLTNVATGGRSSYSTNASALVIYLANGTYTLTVQATGYLGQVSNPTFTVAGKLVGGSPSVQFGTYPRGISSGPPRFWSAFPWEEFSAAAVAALIVAGLLVARGRRQRVRQEGEAWVHELTDSRSPPP
jgi:YVTN family beta-propeller protein